MVAAKKNAPALKAASDINPNHYVINMKDINGQPVVIQTIDLIEALCVEDAHMAHAYTYITRAGRKQSSSYIKDLTKCAWWCRRAVLFAGGTFDLDK